MFRLVRGAASFKLLFVSHVSAPQQEIYLLTFKAASWVVWWEML